MGKRLPITESFGPSPLQKLTCLHSIQSVYQAPLPVPFILLTPDRNAKYSGGVKQLEDQSPSAQLLPGHERDLLLEPLALGLECLDRLHEELI